MSHAAATPTLRAGRPRTGSPVSVFVGVRMTQVPQPLMRGDKAFHIAPTSAVRRQGTARQHHFKNVEQLLRHLKIALVAGVMERDENLVGQASAIPWRCARCDLPSDLFVRMAHRNPCRGGVFRQSVRHGRPSAGGDRSRSPTSGRPGFKGRFLTIVKNHTPTRAESSKARSVYHRTNPHALSIRLWTVWPTPISHPDREVII